MSSVCTTINKANFAAYDTSFNSTNGTCMTGGSAPNKTFVVGATCTDADYACYASYKLDQKRKQLDPDMAELYSGPGSIKNVNNVHFESAMLSGVIWAMLGTTVLYYAFTKM